MTQNKQWIIDFRFIIKASDEYIAGSEIMEFLPNVTDNIQYTIIRKIREVKEKKC